MGNTTFDVWVEYSVRYSVQNIGQCSFQYSAHCSVQCSVQDCVQYSVHYNVIYYLQKTGKVFFSQGISQLSQFLSSLVTFYCTLKWTLYSRVYINFSVQYMCLGCPVTQWDVTIQPLKSRPKLLWQNKGYGGHTFMTYFSLLTRI